MLCSNQLSYIAITVSSAVSTTALLILLSRCSHWLSHASSGCVTPEGRELCPFEGKLSRFRLVDHHITYYCVVIAYCATEGRFSDLFIITVHTRVFAVIRYQWVKAIADYSQIPSKVTVGEACADAE